MSRDYKIFDSFKFKNVLSKKTLESCGKFDMFLNAFNGHALLKES